MSKESPSKSSESVDAILKQIKEFTENDTFSTSSTPLEDPNKLIEDITITSSVGSNNVISTDFSNFSNDDPKISSEEADPDLQYYLSKMSQMSGHDVENLSDAAREFQSMKFDSDSNNDDLQLDANEYLNLFNDRLNVATTSLDEVMDMVEIMQNEKIQGDYMQSPTNQIDYFPNDEDIYIGKNDFLSDDFALNERERKINDIISKQSQRNRSSLRKSQKLLNKQNFSSTQSKPSTTSSANSKITDTDTISPRFDNDEKLNSNLSSQNSQKINKTKPNSSSSITDINKSPKEQPAETHFEFFIEEEEEEKDSDNDDGIPTTKPIVSNSFTNSNPRSSISVKSNSKSASFTEAATDPIQISKSPISQASSSSNSKNSEKSQNSIRPKPQSSSKSSKGSRRGNEEETEEDIFSFSSKGKINPNENDLDEEIRKNNHSISQLLTSSFKSSDTKSNRNTGSGQSENRRTNSFLSNNRENINNDININDVNNEDDVVDIIKNVNEELERNNIDAIEIEEEKSPQINYNSKSGLFRPSQRNNSNSNSNSISSTQNSRSNKNESNSYMPHITNRNKKGLSNSMRSNSSKNNSYSSQSDKNVLINDLDNVNSNSNNDIIYNSNENSEELNIFDFDDNSLNNFNIDNNDNNNNNRSYTGQHMPNTKPNQRQTASLSYYNDSNKNRNNSRSPQRQQQTQPYINNNTSSRRRQLTESDFKNAELLETNRKLIAENELLKQKISELETENEQLKFNSLSTTERASSLEHENEKLASQLSMQEIQVKNLKSSKESVQKAYGEIENLLNNQTKEAQQLAKQRENLLAMLQKQTSICEHYEHLLEDAQKINNSMKKSSSQMNTESQTPNMQNQSFSSFYSNNNIQQNTSQNPQMPFNSQNNMNPYQNQSQNFNQQQIQNFNPNQSYSQPQSYSQNQSFSSNQSFNQNPNYNQQPNFNSNQNFNPNQNFNSNQNFNQQQNFNQNQSFNQQPNFNQPQNFNQNQNFNPNQSFNQQQNFNPNQNFNQNVNQIQYKNDLIQAKTPDFSDLLSQICQSVSDIFGLDKEGKNKNDDNDDDEDKKSLNEIMDEITQLKDASNIPANSRISNIVSFLCSKVKEADDELHTSKTKRSILRKKLNDSQNRELQVLQILEGELRFLQRLAHSSDIQNVVFYRPTLGKPLSLNKESQSELMRHCVSVQKFIDDTIGFYSKDQISTLANGVFSDDNRNSKKINDAEKNTVERIFNLLHSDEFEKGIKYMLSFVSSRILNDAENENNSFILSSKNKSEFASEMNCRQVADLFFAQSIMNEILQNHIIDLQSQVVYSNHQNQKLQIELRDQEDTKAALEYATKEIRHFQRKEEKLMKIISQAIEIPQNLIDETEKNNKNEEEERNLNEKKRKSGRKRSNSVNHGQKNVKFSTYSEYNSDSLSESGGRPPKLRSKTRSSSVESNKTKHQKKNNMNGKDLYETVTTFAQKYCDMSSKLIERENEMKNIVRTIEKMQTNYKKKLEKRSKTIHDLKKIVTSQSNEIESLKNETANVQKKSTEETKQKEIKIGSLKSILRSLQNLRNDIKNMIVKFYKEHQNQIQNLRNNWNNILSNYEHSFESTSRTQESLILLEQERNVLRNRIASDQKSFKKTIIALQKKAQNFRSQYESLSTDVRSLRAENERLSSEHQNALTNLEHAKAELEAALTEKRAVEVKLKASEERFDCERKTLQSQLAAKVMSMQADASNQLKNEQESRLSELQQATLLASPYLNAKGQINSPVFSSTLSIVKALCNVISELIESHNSSAAEASDASSARALLSLSQGSPLCPAISNILRELREIRSKLEKFKKGEKETNNHIEKVERNIQLNSLSSSSSQPSSSSEWESWARRLIAGVSDTNCATLSVDKLKKSIEEAVLASVSQRRLIFMLRSLREEKKALLKFDRTILNSPSPSLSLSSPSWVAVIAVYASIRRMQQLAGCMPMNLRSIQETNRISIIDEDRRRKKKRQSSVDNNMSSRRSRRNEQVVNDYDIEEFDLKANSKKRRKNKGHDQSRHRRNNNNNNLDFEEDNRNNRNDIIDDYNDYASDSDNDYSQKKSRRKYK